MNLPPGTGTIPPGVVLAREEGRLSAEDFVGVIRRSGLRRPSEDLPRIRAMLANANLVVTARTPDAVVGVARALTDFAYCCYLSDLCVDRAWQSRGIGGALVREIRRIIGARCALILLSAPESAGFYPKIGMEPVENGFILKRKS